MAKSKPGSMSRALVRRETISGYLFLLPSLVFFLTFVVYPMFMCVVTSLTNATMSAGGSSDFIGLKNYVDLFQDKTFLKALVNTVIIVVVSVPAVCVFSLWVGARIYNMKNWACSAFRVIFYLPVVTGSVAVTVVWKWIYHYYNGVLNYVGTNLGLWEKNINWLGDDKFALGCIILILFTTSVGQPIVLYVSALGNVDQTLVEAAQVDGHHPVHPGHHHHQQLPVLRADPAAHLRRARARHGHGDVLYLLQRLHPVQVRLRQRHGRHSGAVHCGAVGGSVQAGQI